MLPEAGIAGLDARPAPEVDSCPMQATYLTPLLHVSDVEASIRWYELLGLKVVDTMGDPVFWVRLHCEGDAIMLTGAEKPIDPDAQRVAFYLYSPDLVALREHLLANGVNASEIYYPEYMPSGEVRLRDPDQFYVFVGHWGKKEQENWEKRIAERAK
jgi:hypothetical protein